LFVSATILVNKVEYILS